MRVLQVPSVAFIFMVFQGCIEQPERPVTAQDEPEHSPTPDLAPPTGSKTSATRGYENKVNRLAERRLEVKDDRGKPAVRGFRRSPIRDGELKIVWTYTTQFGWNYCLP